MTRQTPPPPVLSDRPALDLAWAPFVESLLPCTPADLEPRPMDDLVAEKRGIGLLTACVTAAPDLRRYRSLTAHQQTNHFGSRPPHAHCPQLGVPFSELPMCQ